MERSEIIVRNRMTTRSAIASNFGLLLSENHFANRDEFISHYGMQRIMNEVFEEPFNDNSMETSELYMKYIEICKTKEDNSHFSGFYRLGNDLGVKITEHINVFHLVTGLEVEGQALLPWFYYDSKIYIADSWWSSDEEILTDMTVLSFADFLLKYKGY